MEALVILITTLVCLDFIVELTFLKPVYAAGMAVLCALFVGLMCNTAASQSSTALHEFLSDPASMLDMAVFLSVDVIGGITFCWLSVRKADGEPMGFGSRLLLETVRFFPGITVFLILFYMLVNVIFAFPGVSFSLLSWIFAAVVLVSVLLLSYIVRAAMPEARGRLDLMFMAYVLTGMAGGLVTV